VRHRTYHAELGVWVQNVETGTQLNVETGTELVLTGEKSWGGAWRKPKRKRISLIGRPGE
jgi:hypothetical protein